MKIKIAAIVGVILALCVIDVLMWLDVLAIAKPGREPWMVPVGQAADILFLCSGVVIVGSLIRTVYQELNLPRAPLLRQTGGYHRPDKGRGSYNRQKEKLQFKKEE